MDQTLLVISNLPDAQSAETLARALVEQGLAACVNILPAVRSVYRWQGAIEDATEVTLFIKTAAHRYPELETAVRRLHPYEVPELIALPITAGLPAYLQWVIGETRKDVDV
ncbi:divalent-cation tolerance protein CutA [Noviherbaspirillum aridicola]|uniref:Divalent cation tolerance protein n=1 Tax=Noviherbaspirillum aridicola TaxID=2849687 RepID=A0ABQ4Q8L9_9BURK|nr:divalent-cation tolerance protein CutA [Noviherbaspirillum aridicola]GIZ53409.1 divalent cation tolerance protein [Noviherbaspirillum aridicola]